MKPISIKPSYGGVFMPDLSAGSIGWRNYSVKRDWRRVLDREVRAEGHVKFAPNLKHADVGQAYPPGVDGPITLLAEAILPSGSCCVVVGTATTLWAYFGLTDATYVNGDGDGPYVEADYFDDNPGDWVEIGSGFSGTQLWEAVSVGSWLVLNNGVDLPMTYRVGESAVVPIYELREQGIASVGTIAEMNGILCCMDIRQIPTQTHTALMTPIAAAVDGSVAGSVSLGNGRNLGIGNTTVVSDSPVFTGLSGRLKFLGNIQFDFVSTFNPYVGILSNPTAIAVPTIQPMNLMPLVADDDRKVTPSAATLFPSLDPASLIGQNLIWVSGETTKITSVSGGYFYVASDSTIPSGPVSVENPAAYARYSGITDRRHNRKLWSMPTLPRRFAAQIPCTVNPASNAVKLKYPAKSLVNGMSVLIVGAGVGGNNLTADILLAYPGTIILSASAITESAAAIASAAAEASVAEAVALAAKTSADATLTRARSALEDAVAATLAGPTPDTTPPVTMADLTKAQSDASAAVDAAIAASTAADAAYVTAQEANTTAQAASQPQDTTLVAADAEASIAGLFEDLEGDGSGIVRAANWGNLLVIYKESGSIFIARYTGSVTAPFVYEEIRVPIECCLPAKHKFTLIAVNDNTHIYAAASGIYEFNTTQRQPVLFEPLRACSRLFLDAAGADKFACNNAVTREIMFCCPSSVGADKALCYDYLYGTARTTSAPWTAGATIRQPLAEGATQSTSWFIGGTSLGGIMRYGLVEESIISVASGYCGDILSGKVFLRTEVNSATAVFTDNHVGRTIVSADGHMAVIINYRTPTKVYVNDHATAWAGAFRILPAVWNRDGAAYDSVLQSGLEDFGAAHHEKLLNSYVLLPGSETPDTTSVSVVFRGGVNPAKAADLQSALMASPNTQNLLKPTVLQYYLGDRITVSGQNNPFELQERVLTIVPRQSASFGRRGNGL